MFIVMYKMGVIDYLKRKRCFKECTRRDVYC